MYKKFIISREELYNLYEVCNLTAHKIAERFGVDDSTVTDHLKKHGINIRNKQRQYEQNCLIHLTKDQKNVLIGTMLGDAHLHVVRSGRLASLMINHSIKQKEYIEQKAKIFEIQNIHSAICFNKNVQKYYGTLSIRGKATSELLDFHNIFYRNNIKTVPDNIDKMLTSPISLAYWIMDDGTLHKQDHRLTICCESFSFDEQNRLVAAIRSNFGITAKVNKYGNKHRIRFGQKDTRELSTIIEPFVVDSMKYKLIKSTNKHF